MHAMRQRATMGLRQVWSESLARQLLSQVGSGIGKSAKRLAPAMFRPTP